MRKKVIYISGLLIIIAGICSFCFWKKESVSPQPVVSSIQINPTEFLIEKMDTPVPGIVVSPENTETLRKWFQGSDENHVPRVFVDRLPSDFPEKGTPILFARVISALILRTNETIMKERAVLIFLKNKLEQGKAWTDRETQFFNHLVQKYDSKSRRTVPTQMEDLMVKVNKIPPAMAVMQAAEATSWGKENLNSPFEQTGWLDSKTYTRIPFESLIQATDSYAREMNGMPPLGSWRYIRSTYMGRGEIDVGYRVLRWLHDYKQGDTEYTDRLDQKQERLRWFIPDTLSFIKPERFQNGIIRVNDHPFDVEYALTPEQKEQGFMFRVSIPEDTGMIFLQGKPQEMAIWMKNTFLPLDILFFDKDNKIMAIVEHAEPLDETPHPSQGLAKGVIELPAGTVQKYQIKIGDKVSFKL